MPNAQVCGIVMLRKKRLLWLEYILKRTMSTDYRSILSGSHAGDAHIAKDIQRAIEQRLFRLGLLCHVFSRVKSADSLLEKLSRDGDKYHSHGKKVQDMFGIRVVLYFQDDSEIAQDVVRSMYDFDSHSVTDNKDDIFGPMRCNLIFRLPLNLAERSFCLEKIDLLDRTFEVQFRTVLSEGWHEVEHDLRYKHKGDWSVHEDLSRALNGVVATLESCDWTMLKIFDELAWRHYKCGDYDAMMRAKFRLRFRESLTRIPELWELFRDDIELPRTLIRVERRTMLKNLMRLSRPLPINSQNIIFACNRFFLRDQRIADMEPPPVRKVFDMTDFANVSEGVV